MDLVVELVIRQISFYVQVFAHFVQFCGVLSATPFVSAARASIA